MASNLSNTVPQWKKDLILRKRTQSKCLGKRSSDELACTAHRSSLDSSCEKRAVKSTPNKRLDTAKPVSMVQDSVMVLLQRETVNNGREGIQQEDSDSSEELQYGPGIVSKLKSKYLSLTLREKTATKPRPTILGLRRATSLENMLEDNIAQDEQERKEPEVPRRFTKSPDTRNGVSGQRYRSTTRTAPESIKRARSVETIQPRRQLSNENITIIEKTNNTEPVIVEDKKKTCCNGAPPPVNRPKRLTPFMDEGERPPADHVKHTMLLFEDPIKRTKPPKSTGEVAAKVANFKNIIDKEKSTSISNNNNNNNNNNIKKNGVHKPVITAPKPSVNRTRRQAPTSPRKAPQKSSSNNKLETTISPPDVAPRHLPPDVSRISDTPQIDKDSRIMSDTPDLILHSSPAQRLPSPNTVKRITETFINSEVKHSQIDMKRPGKYNERNRSPSPLINNLIRSPTSPITSPVPPVSPTGAIASLISPVSSPTPPPQVTSPDTYDGVSTKQVNMQQVEKIGQASHSVTFSIPDNIPKSHLPKLGTVPVGINRLVPDRESTKPSQPLTTRITSIATAAATPEAVNELVAKPKLENNKIPTTTANIRSNISMGVNRQAKISRPPPISTNPPVTHPPNPPNYATHPVHPLSSRPLTSREIAKNIINNAKTLQEQQPISKVVVSVRSVEEVVGGGNRRNRGNEQTSLLFNFQDRETVPDYIAHDSNTYNRRGKRERPKVRYIFLHFINKINVCCYYYYCCRILLLTVEKIIWCI